MLAALEAHFAAALQAALAPVAVLRGPAALPPAGASVHVLAYALALTLPADDLARGRGPARLFSFHAWDSDGAARDFPLPPGAGEVAEVEAPPGRLRARGDDYQLAPEGLRFYRPPPAGAPGVRALLLGAPARGHVERRPAELSLLITARADTAAALDVLVAAALAAALAACVAPPTLEEPLAAGARARLLRPTAALSGLSRSAETRGLVQLPRADLTLAVRGDAELLVALGAPEPTSVIAAVKPGTIDID